MAEASLFRLTWNTGPYLTESLSMVPDSHTTLKQCCEARPEIAGNARRKLTEVHGSTTVLCLAVLCI